MKPDGGFIENIKDSDEPTPNLRGQTDALPLSSREGIG
jgi:hypothetical protein